MEKLLIKGGKSLKGTIMCAGAKNAALTNDSCHYIVF